MSRLWQPRETRLLSEWVSKFYPDDEVLFRVRVGSYPTWAEQSIKEGAPPEIYKIYQRWVDAIVITKEGLVLIEAKIKADPGVIGQILLYKRLLLKTPEFSKFMDRPIRLVILMALRDVDVEMMAEANKIEVQYYHPAWVKQYLIETRKYRERF